MDVVRKGLPIKSSTAGPTKDSFLAQTIANVSVGSSAHGALGLKYLPLMHIGKLTISAVAGKMEMSICFENIIEVMASNLPSPNLTAVIARKRSRTNVH